MTRMCTAVRLASVIRWLVSRAAGRDGKLVGSYGAGIEALSAEYIGAIEAALGSS